MKQQLAKAIRKAQAEPGLVDLLELTRISEDVMAGRAKQHAKGIVKAAPVKMPAMKGGKGETSTGMMKGAPAKGDTKKKRMTRTSAC